MTRDTVEQTLQDERDVKRVVWIVVLFLVVVAAFVLQLLAYLDSRDALHKAKQALNAQKATNAELRKTNLSLRLRAAEGKQAHDVQCATKSRLRDQVADTERFVRSGGHIPGVSDVLIQQNLQKDRAQLRTFERLLRCKGDSPHG